MLPGTLKQFNWVDIFVVILILRISYIAIKNGLAIELFKLLGTILAVYLSLHYYTKWSDFMSSRMPAKNVPLEVLSPFSFVILVILGYLVFVLLRKIFLRFIKFEPVLPLNKWGGFILGIGRAILLVSLIIFMLVISNIDYPKNSIKNSYSGKFLFKVAPSTYAWLYNNIVSKFMPQEKFNAAVLEVQRGF